jgi:hypothetical protein
MCVLFHTCLRLQVSLYVEKGPESRMVVSDGSSFNGSLVPDGSLANEVQFWTTVNGVAI